MASTGEILTAIHLAIRNSSTNPDAKIDIDQLGFGILTQEQLDTALLEFFDYTLPPPPPQPQQEPSLVVPVPVLVRVSESPESCTVMRLLLDKGANANITIEEDGTTPLGMAVSLHHIPEMKLLLENGARATSKPFHYGGHFYNDHLNTVLSWAVYCGFPDTLELLLKYDADRQSPPGITYFAAGNTQGTSLEQVQLLIAAGEDPLQVFPPTGMTLCEMAFAVAVRFEQEMLLHGSDTPSTYYPPDCPMRNAFDIYTAGSVPDLHHDKMRLISYLLDRGCPAPSMRLIRYAVECRSFLTLIETYAECLKRDISLQWPEEVADVPAPTWQQTPSYPASVEILTAMIRRTSTAKDSQGTARFLRYLSELIERGRPVAGPETRPMDRPEIMPMDRPVPRPMDSPEIKLMDRPVPRPEQYTVPPRLSDLTTANIVLNILSSEERSVEKERRKIEVSPLPVSLQKKLKLIDLKKEFEKLQKNFNAHFFSQNPTSDF